MSRMTSQPPLSIPAHDLRKIQGRNNAKWLPEETTIYTETRMLQDQTGRLLYIGDASTLSILQLTRIIIENTAGPEISSPFTDDPKRHRILESIIDFPGDVRIPGPLPDKETADVLIASYFTNTCGLVEIFDKADFLKSVEECYQDPLSSENDLLCNVYLVLAIGLLLATPTPGSREEEIVQKQLSAQPNRAELFFRSARSMCDPMAGFEDADLWSIQSLALMTIYMLIISKRNRAYAYLGMAIRSAFALGLHREETMRDVIFRPKVMKVRRNLWKTLFILDRFLAATLGRPTAISEEDCSCKILPDDGAAEMPAVGGPDADHIHERSLNACVDSAHIIGVTLKAFSRRKISTAKVQEIVDMSKPWDHASVMLRYGRHPGAEAADPAQRVASLHAGLFALHSLILLTRQLFVMHNWMLVEERSGIRKSGQTRESPMARFSEACVVASYRTIQLARSAWEDGCLPRRNPFVIYFVFAASLVILMNQFSSLYYTNEYDQTMRDALNIVEYCAEIDPQAQRVLDIITRFSQVVGKWTENHAHSAPKLSDDFSCLYSQPPHSGAASGHMPPGPALDAGIHVRISPQAARGPDPGLLTPPSIPKVPTLGLLSAQASSAALEARASGMSPPHVSIPAGTLVGTHPSIAAPSSLPTAEQFGGNFEFDIDGLWYSCTNYLPPVSTVAPGISSLTLPFPPPAIGAPTEPYDKPVF
ncbi:hypothetical protein VTH06DRAFT_3840 [Thermothelomyces fergusii]